MIENSILHKKNDYNNHNSNNYVDDKYNCNEDEDELMIKNSILPKDENTNKKIK